MRSIRLPIPGQTRRAESRAWAPASRRMRYRADRRGGLSLVVHSGRLASLSPDASAHRESGSEWGKRCISATFLLDSLDVVHEGLAWLAQSWAVDRPSAMRDQEVVMRAVPIVSVPGAVKSVLGRVAALAALAVLAIALDRKSVV